MPMAWMNASSVGRDFAADEARAGVLGRTAQVEQHQPGGAWPVLSLGGGRKLAANPGDRAAHDPLVGAIALGRQVAIPRLVQVQAFHQGPHEREVARVQLAAGVPHQLELSPLQAGAGPAQAR